MADQATITVTSGPDRGKSFSLRDGMVNIGRGDENDLALSDGALAEYQASIVNRGGRYAIYTPVSEAVSIEGRVIPTEKWVWLPAAARVAISERTTLHFQSNGDAPGSSDRADEEEASLEDTQQIPETVPASQAANRPQRRTTVRTGRKQAEPKQQPSAQRRKKPPAPERRKEKPAVARFITDQGGDALVKLGEDGQLPELNLAAAQEKKGARARDKREGGNPAVYIAVGISVLMTIAMLFMDSAGPGRSRGDKASARKEIESFYGLEEKQTEPYQELLREARRAHSRGDVPTERAAYRRVLDLLNSDDVHRSITGLTGAKNGNEPGMVTDERLRTLVGVLLSR